ncbi:unnamed protein product [Rhizoctonia solani]|uniref:Uncharacterized protein n=1 Tax=Rhizoctonia solani TaxID=456999 RepID=A0A8H2XXV8_9AGAM|nr:unnamed protein product [Rhizoctonia solani]
MSNVSSIATAPIPGEFEGKDFKIVHNKTGTKIRITYNKGIVPKASIFPAPTPDNKLEVKRASCPSRTQAPGTRHCALTDQLALKKKTTPEENLDQNNSWGNNLNDELQALRAVAAMEEGKKRKKRSDETLASSDALPDTEGPKPQKWPIPHPPPLPESSTPAQERSSSVRPAAPPVTTRATKTKMMDQVEGGSERGPTRQSTRPKKLVKR